MKVKVRYFAVVEETVEVNDKFNVLRWGHPDYENLSNREEEKLTDELLEEANNKITKDAYFDGITYIEAVDTEECLFEM